MSRLEKSFWISLLFLALLFDGWIINEARSASNRTSSASWYGPGLYGSVMGCGGTLTPQTWGVANRSLPCGTRLVVCLKRCANVKVVDRGPWVGGRDFDLTAPVAKYIGLVGVQRIDWRYR